MELDPKDIDGIINDVGRRNSNENGNPINDTGLLNFALEDTRGRTKTNRYLGFGAGVLAIAGLVAGGGTYLGQSGNSEKITSLDDRVAGIEQRIGPDVLDIRSYLIDDGEDGCVSLGGQVAESNNDRQYGWSDCRFTPEQYGNNPHAFAERVIVNEYSNDMLSLADERDDLTRDDFTRAGLEALLNSGYAGIIAEEAPQRQTAPSHSHTLTTQTTTHTPTTTQPKQCGTDVVDVLRRGVLGVGRIDKTGEINDCQDNYTSGVADFIGDICSNGYTVNGSFTQNPASYITQLNGEGGQSQHFSVRCHYNNDSPTVHSGGGDGPTGGGGGTSEPGEPNGGRGSQAGGHAGQSTK